MSRPTVIVASTMITSSSLVLESYVLCWVGELELTDSVPGLAHTHLASMVTECVKHWVASIIYPCRKHSWEPLCQYLSHFPKVLCTLHFLLHDSMFSFFCFKWRNLMWYSDLALAFESRDWKPWCLSVAAPLEAQSSPFFPMISPSSSQEELQTTLGKFCFDISVQRAWP